MDTASDQELAIALARMSRNLLSQDTVQNTLNSIVEHAVDLVDGCEHAGILLLHNRRQVETAAATSELVRRSDTLQGELCEGPCFDAADNGVQVYRIADMTGSVQRWAQYAPYARDLGIASMMGLLLYTDEEEYGALDLYSSRPEAFGEHSELVGWVVASHAAVAFSSARMDAQLQTAITTRQRIGEALGIVMERYRIDEEQAFQVLKRSSQHRNIKLRDIADHVTSTGEIPGAR
ncbi:GAF domain-containing protein [Saccharopolyspora erythraea NRRL 2338]|uniref:Uncharacterized protein n=2 Tax=Saccharopolyspora erythraea TaxID=1836 RepID=A4FFQ1_SACEN|nr:GAF and ANTAR domain-containing protein [Saccharopolyspora erythraea]EQD83157.1 transcription antitermination regulator [Saccharopolyspora erythraea D]PFG96596.1 GAF domain-containing protein [Saccharopolyspora erythraea NRRL 2338]QRK93072.1 GAF and ANTAR domain-containing protein [Saccharopolyspora erythraea]CAM02876.1 hypothetical protein SACE_3602 [Saccharopolyspora erythraea NRRL 2338]